MTFRHSSFLRRQLSLELLSIFCKKPAMKKKWSIVPVSELRSQIGLGASLNYCKIYNGYIDRVSKKSQENTYDGVVV